MCSTTAFGSHLWPNLVLLEQLFMGLFSNAYTMRAGGLLAKGLNLNTMRSGLRLARLLSLRSFTHLLSAFLGCELLAFTFGC